MPILARPDNRLGRGLPFFSNEAVHQIRLLRSSPEKSPHVQLIIRQFLQLCRWHDEAEDVAGQTWTFTTGVEFPHKYKPFYSETHRKALVCLPKMIVKNPLVPSCAKKTYHP